MKFMICSTELSCMKSISQCKCWRKQLHYLFTFTRTLESLCQELVEQGLLKQANNVRLQDYLGKTSYIVCVNWCAIFQISLCVLMIMILCVL